MKTIAIIGASRDRSKFGNKAVRAYLKKGWLVYPVNLKEPTIEGLKVYQSILDIGDKIKRVGMYLPPETGLKVIDEIAKKKPEEVFFNPGTAGEKLLRKATDLGLNVIQDCAILAIGERPAEY